MYLDDLVKWHKSRLKKMENIEQLPLNFVVGVLKNFEKFGDDYYESCMNGLGKLTDTLENKAKLFMIDEMVLDSLYNVPHNNPNYENSIKLPFPHIFFEFEKPFGVTLENKEKEKISGMLFSSEDNKLFTTNLFFDNLNLYLDPFSRSHYIIFNSENLPKFTYINNNGVYEYNPREDHLESMDTNLNLRTDFSEDDYIYANEFYKIIDLTINLINYINAENVEIVRKTPSKDLDRVTAKRLRKSKKPLIWVPTKPYYIVEVKKEIYKEIEKLDKEDKAWELNYRVWVRGHFYHFKHPMWGKKVGTHKWIPPHIRGPYNAPWKHNRYKVLYKNLRHKLHSRKNESI